MRKEKRRDISVSVEPNYVAEQSDPVRKKFVWSYEVTIANQSDEVIQLLHRYWLITDAEGKLEDIHGIGVIGMQPVIKPARNFIYTSFCQLTTPQGVMEGHYEFQTLNEDIFEVAIPRFVLAAPMSIAENFRSQLH